MKELLNLKEKLKKRTRERERNFLDAYAFSSHAPENSLESKLIDELVEAKKYFDSIPIWKHTERKEAKQKVNIAAKAVLKAHEEFLERGEIYVTSDGKPIEDKRERLFRIVR